MTEAHIKKLFANTGKSYYKHRKDDDVIDVNIRKYTNVGSVTDRYAERFTPSGGMFVYAEEGDTYEGKTGYYAKGINRYKKTADIDIGDGKKIVNYPLEIQETWLYRHHNNTTPQFTTRYTDQDGYWKNYEQKKDRPNSLNVTHGQNVGYAGRTRGINRANNSNRDTVTPTPSTRIYTGDPNVFDRRYVNPYLNVTY